MRLNVGFLLHQDIGYSRNFEFDHPILTLGELELTAFTGSLRLTRTSPGVYTQGHLHGTTLLECVRCLSPFQKVLTADIQELYTYPPDPTQDDTPSIGESGIIDLTPIVRESMLLDVPIKIVCKDDCRGLCPVCGNNLNESKCDHPDIDIDPRFEVLRTLLPKS